MKNMVYFVVTWNNSRTGDHHKYMCCFEENLDKVGLRKINNLRSNSLNSDIRYKFISYNDYLNGKAEDQKIQEEKQTKSRVELQKMFAEHCQKEIDRLNEV